MAIPAKDVESEPGMTPANLSAWDARLAVQGKPFEGTDDSWADLRFDRVVSQDLMAELEQGGQFHDLLERRVKSEIADVQLRRDQRGKQSWASLYIGLTSVLDLDERGGQFRLRAHATHKKAGQFDEAWAMWQSADKLAGHWLGVNAYLDRLLAADGIVERLWRREGVIHAALASGQSTAYGAVQREAVVSFPSQVALFVRSAPSKTGSGRRWLLPGDHVRGGPASGTGEYSRHSVTRPTSLPWTRRAVCL